MSQEFASFGALASYLEARRVEAAPAIQVAMHIELAKVAAEARRLFGQYQPDWKPLAESTVAERTNLGFAPDDPLLRTGALRRSVESDVAPPVPAGLGVLHRGEVGSDAPVMLIQEQGDSHVSPRPVIGPVTAHTAPHVVEKVTEAVLDALT